MKALEPEIGPDEDDIVSPLKGKTIPTAVTIIGVAIAIPGGLYVLLALVIAPLFIRGFLKTARRRLERGEPQRALEAANLAVRLKRKSATARAERAAILLEMGDLDAALTDVQTALDRRPKLAAAHYVRGRIAQQRGDAQTALEHYTAYIENTKQPGDERDVEVRQRITGLQQLTKGDPHA